jgi:hypothetical protein
LKLVHSTCHFYLYFAIESGKVFYLFLSYLAYPDSLPIQGLVLPDGINLAESIGSVILLPRGAKLNYRLVVIEHIKNLNICLSIILTLNWSFKFDFFHMKAFLT